MSSIALDARRACQLLRSILLVRGDVGGEGPVPSAARRVLDQRVEPGAEGQRADDPGHPERRAHDRRADGDRRPALARVEGHRDAELRWTARSGRSRAATPGGRRRRAARIRSTPTRVARTRSEQDASHRAGATSSSAPSASTSDIDVDTGVGLGRPRLADRHQDGAADREHARRRPAPATMTGSDGEDHADGALGSAEAQRPAARGRSSAVSAIRRCRAWAPATSAARPATAAKAANPTARTLVPSSTFVGLVRVLADEHLLELELRDDALHDRRWVVAGGGGDLDRGSEATRLAPVLLVEGRRGVEAH